MSVSRGLTDNQAVSQAAPELGKLSWESAKREKTSAMHVLRSWKPGTRSCAHY